MWPAAIDTQAAFPAAFFFDGIEMRIAGSGIAEHQLDKANDNGEVVAQKVYGLGIKRDGSPAGWHICTQFRTSTIIRVQALRGCRRHTVLVSDNV